MALAATGYFVLMPNPRGSFGQGEAFTRANVRDFGYGDLRDILAGVDEAVQSRSHRSQSLGITGWSYGGYMTMWAVTQTNRFKAAMAGAGIANFQSYYGENKIDQWMIPFFGKSVYDDPEVYAKSSPITFIKNQKPPRSSSSATVTANAPRRSPMNSGTPQNAWRRDPTGGLRTRRPSFRQPRAHRDRIRRPWPGSTRTSARNFWVRVVKISLTQFE